MERELKVVIKNATYLLLIKGLAYILPLLLLGYLVKTLNIENFGRLSIILAICAYAQVIGDYGFALTSSRNIANKKNCKKELSRIYMETTILKIGLTLLTYPFFYYFLLVYFENSEILFLSLVSYSLVIGQVLFPTWFFQGVEKLGLVALFNLFAKLTSFVFTFVFVKTENDTIIALMVQSIPSLFFSLLCNVIIIKYYIVFDGVVITKNSLWISLKDGWSIFLSSLSAALLTNSAILVLGSSTSSQSVGIYAAAERLAKAVVSLFSPITQAIYPYNCRKFSDSYMDGLRSVKKTGMPIILLAGFCSLFIYIFSDVIGNGLGLAHESIIILNIFIFWIFFGVVNNVLGIQVLCASSHSNVYSKSFIICSFISMTLLLLLSVVSGGVGAAIAVTVGEMLLTLFLFFNVKRVHYVNLII